MPPNVSIDLRSLMVMTRFLASTKGPFVIVGRDSGLALDTAWRHDDEHPILWPVHGEPHQLWRFRRTTHPGQFLIVSEENGLALDARRGGDDGRWPKMRACHGEAHQRWRLLPVKERAAWVIESIRTREVLHKPTAAMAESRTSPTMRRPDGRTNQQWLIMNPFRGPS
ncbi:RICIN domain-containing protein [Catenulispora pinisilvae]|uniref:RICIN domain-containing protein n=1 Tax=Catenulispora pinisilvae TaxID=2705253 RepID=UPI0018926C6F|nr:RICIN domain-containing protein [Catenulispora pinisilvae]